MKKNDCVQHGSVDKDAVVRGKGRILVVDDEEVIRESSRVILGELGYDVVSSSDAAEAIEIYKNSISLGDGFDAVITDLNIPGGMGGKDLMRHLRMINPDVKGIVSSGYSDDPIISHYMDYGFCGVIPKPYRIKDLTAILCGVIKGMPSPGDTGGARGNLQSEEFLRSLQAGAAGPSRHAPVIVPKEVSD